MIISLLKNFSADIFYIVIVVKYQSKLITVLFLNKHIKQYQEISNGDSKGTGLIILPRYFFLKEDVFDFHIIAIIE